MFVIIVFTYLTTTAGYCAAKRRYYLLSPHIFYFYYVYIIFTYVLITFICYRLHILLTSAAGTLESQQATTSHWPVPLSY